MGINSAEIPPSSAPVYLRIRYKLTPQYHKILCSNLAPEKTLILRDKIKYSPWPADCMTSIPPCTCIASFGGAHKRSYSKFSSSSTGELLNLVQLQVTWGLWVLLGRMIGVKGWAARCLQLLSVCSVWTLSQSVFLEPLQMIFFQVPQFMFIFTMKLDSEKSVHLVRLWNYNMGTMPSVQRTWNSLMII